MDYKAIEKPPTPPDTPSYLEEDRTLVDSILVEGSALESPSASTSSSASNSPYLNGSGNGHDIGNGGHHHASLIDNDDVKQQGSPALLSVFSDSDKKRSIRPSSSARGLTVDSSKKLPPPSSPSQAYPVPETLQDQLHYTSRALAQRARLFLGLASQTVINVLPSTPTTARPPSPSTSQLGFPTASTSRHSPARSPSPSPILHPSTSPRTSPSLSSTSRLLTGGGSSSSSSSRNNGKARDRAENNEAPPPAWHTLVQVLQQILPGPSTGPKRIRTRTRRYLIFLACLSLLCYVFSNTLQEAYYSADIVRQQHDFEMSEKERLGPHLTEFKKHPIEELMENAKKAWEEKVARQSKTAEEAIQEYKRRYKRDPPYGFTEWFAYAKSVGSVLVDEYDSLMASLEPFWAIEAAEIRRRTFQIGMQPSFALVHVEEGQGKDGGGTFWDANEDEELIKYYGVERARGFERMVRPFVGRPGIVNMVFAINELAEPRVLVPWEEKQIIEQAIKENTTVNLRQLNTIPSKNKRFFPDPVWKGDGTTWDVFIRTCPPNSAVRKQLTSMTNKVVHLADVLHVAYNSTSVGGKSKRRGKKIADTVSESDQLEVQVNPKTPSKRRRSVREAQSGRMPSPAAVHDGEAGITHSEGQFRRPGKDGIPTRDVHLNNQDFHFLSNMTSLSHDQLCNDSQTHDMQGQFCSDFRSLDSLYPVFSPSTMPGFADVVIPSHYYAATGPKYHLEAHRKKVKKAVKDPKTGKWGQIMVLEEFPAWHERRNKIFWRGSTTGGGNNPAGRQLNYQRHRFIRMTSDNSTDPRGVVLPPHNGTNDMSYVELPMQRVNEETIDAAFTSLDGCGHEKVCDAVREGGYKIGSKVPLIDVTKYKMLIDIDGMAYSARLMALFESGAAVLKSTIYTEYYSDQIQPWYHFIPISAMYSELYNVYSYFLGSPAVEATPETLTDSNGKIIPIKQKQEVRYEPHPHIAAPDNEGAHEAELQAMGERGQDWQMNFGKTRDMEVYVYRLALEWGRLWQKDGPVGTF